MHNVILRPLALAPHEIAPRYAVECECGWKASVRPQGSRFPTLRLTEAEAARARDEHESEDRAAS